MRPLLYETAKVRYRRRVGGSPPTLAKRVRVTRLANRRLGRDRSRLVDGRRSNRRRLCGTNLGV